MGVLLAVLKVLGVVVLVLLAIVVLGIVISYMVQAWGSKCYATPEEQAMRYPGDELMDRFDPKLVQTVTAANTIDAPIEKVWPWIYQWGGMKSGSLSSEIAERWVAHISIYNRYELEDCWQQPDSLMPGDFEEWDRSGMGHEIADVVDCKYILGFSDMKHPPKARGAFALSGSLVDDMNFIWGWYFVPLPGGRTRFIVHWKYYESKSKIMQFALRRVVLGCGTAMQRWQMEYVKKCVDGTMPVHRMVKLFRRILGTYYSAPKEVQERMHCSMERDGRWNPAVDEVRPSKMADPAWPSADGPWDVDEDYYRRHIPEAIEEIKAKSAEQQRVAKAKIDALNAEMAAIEAGKAPASKA